MWYWKFQPKFSLKFVRSFFVNNKGVKCFWTKKPFFFYLLVELVTESHIFHIRVCLIQIENLTTFFLRFSNSFRPTSGMFYYFYFFFLPTLKKVVMYVIKLKFRRKVKEIFLQKILLTSNVEFCTYGKITCFKLFLMFPDSWFR